MRSSIILMIIFGVFNYPGQIVAQKKSFSPGYYISQSGDTMKGFILMTGGDRLKIFKFKPVVSDNDSKLISFDTCKSISTKGNSYINWYGKRSMTYVDKVTYEIRNIDSFSFSNITLKLLYSGNPLSLYYYEDKTEHFFAGLNDTITELAISYRFLTDWEKRLELATRNPPTYYTNPIYRGQIIALLKNEATKKQRAYIDNCNYEVRSLTRLFKFLDINK